VTTVKVRIEWPPGLQLPGGSGTARVTVEDVTHADAPAQTVAERRVPVRDTTAPLETALDVPEIDDSAHYNLRVHLSPSGAERSRVKRGDVISTQSYPVLTFGNPDAVIVTPRVV
jgi:hypothetical protein